MRIVVFGKNGQIGWELCRTLAPLGEVFSFGLDDLNLTDLAAIKRTLERIRPDVIVNAAAYTAVDRAETEQDLAFQVNAQAPEVMAETARNLEAVFIHYSTDYVFDGEKHQPYTESDDPNPINIYGSSKLAGEEAVQSVSGAFLILRTAWVYSLRRDSFVTKVLRWARQRSTLRVVADQVSSPTWARLLAETTSLLLAKGDDQSLYDYFYRHAGVFHLAGKGSVSRLGWAEAILEQDPAPEERRANQVQPALSTDFQTAAQRPKYSALNCDYFEVIFGIRVVYWEEGLKLAMNTGTASPENR